MLIRPNRCRALRLLAACLLAFGTLSSPRASAADGPTGEQIYKQRCVVCHGPKGEGTDEAPQPLQGSRSVAQLSKLIARTMPKDAPKKCTAEESDKVAAYIHNAFYSKLAQERDRPARIELARLTVRQYRNAVADLIGSFRTPGTWDDRRGLKAEYYKARRFRPNDRVVQRVDSEVDFDFGTNSPVADKLDPHEFSIRWEGAVLAPETGDYEFIINTDHAGRLWINDPTRPLIDAWVKSGKDTEFRGSIFLLGGRVYPLRLEFSKAKQGVDDSEKNKGKPKPMIPATIKLLWKPPHRIAEVIPQRCLTPNTFPRLFAVATPFPPDDRSIGYERGTSVSKEWDNATTEGAIETAAYVVEHLKELAGVRDVSTNQIPALKEFSKRFVERAFRRPLTTDLIKVYVDGLFEGAPDPETAVKRVVLLTLKSPRFLYREVGGIDPWNVAARLSFSLWDSLPDPKLLDAARAGQLKSRDQVSAQANRMLSDLRARAKVREFLLQWLKVDLPPDVSRDPKRFPGFTPALVNDLRTSLDLFLEDVIWGHGSDFRRLVLEDDLYLNGPLARFYGIDLPADAPFQKVEVDPGRHAGILSHPYLMAAFAYTNATSPIHRGVFLARGLLGISMRPPPEAVSPLAPDLHPSLTTRERTILQTSPQACQTCHSVINPLGFTLENFDAVGRFRDKEQGKPIDPTGSYQLRNGTAVKFRGVRELAAFLAGSEEAHEAFVEQLFHYLVKQPIRAHGADQLTTLRQAFVRNDFNVRKLMVDIVTVSALAAPAEKP